MVKVQRGLGKGLSALIAETNAHVATMERSQVSHEAPQAKPSAAGNPQLLAVAKLSPGMYQPRTVFNEEHLHELAQSIEQKGIIQPLLVREKSGGDYEIVAGERRFRAAQMAGLKEVPVIIKKMTDDDALEVALIENIQREDLNPLEEARAYERLIREFQYTQEEVGESVGKSRSHIANLLRLLKLPDAVKTMLENGDLTMGHARALLTAKDPLVLANQIVHGGLNVRAAEAMAKGRAGQQAKPRADQKQEPYQRPKDPDILALEETLSENLGLKVCIEDKGAGGEVVIAYETLAELDQVLQRLGGAL